MVSPNDVHQQHHYCSQHLWLVVTLTLTLCSSTCYSDTCIPSQYKTQGKCYVCPEGYKCPDGVTSYPCYGGEYQPNAGETDCQTCVESFNFASPPHPYTYCSPWRNCYEGYVQTAEPTLTSQRKCQRCTTGYFVTNSPPNPTECIEWQDCSIGEYEAVEGANYEDRTCAPCSPGSFSTTINQEQLNLGTIAKQGHTLQCRAQHLPIELVQLVLVESTRQAKTLKSA
eukprot:m.314129 g.314129  ORF g.314129 m.314129 type:complete len:226 (+) comp15970_c0_seq2:92-769(+)